MSTIVVIGGGGHARVVISILKKVRHYHVFGYTDVKDNGLILGVPYLGRDSELAAVDTRPDQLNAVLAIGQVGLGHMRSQLWMRLQTLGLPFPLIVSPHAVVNEGVEADEGTVVMDGAVLNTGVKIGRGGIVNTNSTVEHDVVLGDWVHVAPGATISGSAKVGSFSMIGAGATVIEGISIASDCMIGAGSTVVDDLSDPGVYVGSPARRIR